MPTTFDERVRGALTWMIAELGHAPPNSVLADARSCSVHEAVGGDAEISTRLGGEREQVVVQIRNGAVQEPDLLFRLSTPPRHWWANVIHACASFQPFPSEEEIDRWCTRHALPRGAVVPLPQLWEFARDWYGAYLEEPWRKRSAQDAEQLFRRHGFTSPFWSLT